PFTTADGRTIDVPTMYTEFSGGSTHATYTQLNGRYVIDLPFEQDRMSFVIVVPERDGIPNQLTPDLFSDIDAWLQTPRDTPWFQLTLPQFKLNVSSDLTNVLQQMGMSSAFHDANFSRITDAPIFIDQVQHQASVEVNAKGVSAVGATSVGFLGCFAAGTPVLTPDGERPIEELRVGDYVLSRNEFHAAGVIRPRRIEEVFHGKAEVIQLHLGSQVLHVTEDHRFYLEGSGWTRAGDLRRGQRLSVDLSTWMTIDDIVDTGEVVPVHNFRVAQFHTYFVGSESWGFAIWTHNCYANSCKISVDRPFQFFIRDNDTGVINLMTRVDDPTIATSKIVPLTAPIPGDSNHDGHFNSADLVLVLQAGEYEDAIAGNSTFEEGDWDRDGDFTSRDLVYALANSRYESDSPAAVASQFSRSNQRLPDIAAAVDSLMPGAPLDDDALVEELSTDLHLLVP
ncbi:MAG: Hint domain-containing protein, partial [Planctomycetales bacterium]|nr:Hint domain-containing protein [Planctomycetales bacterium]